MMSLDVQKQKLLFQNCNYIIRAQSLQFLKGVNIVCDFFMSTKRYTIDKQCKPR